MILVPSVPHTGTHFVRDHLLAGCPVPVKCEHIYPNSRVDLERIAGQAGVTTIVPLRHPMAVALSWKQRGKELALLPDYWRRLVTHIDRHEPCYLPVDHPCRDAFLDRLNARLRARHDFEVQAGDWPVLRDDTPKAVAWLDLGELSTTADLMRELDRFFMRFYDRPGRVLGQRAYAEP